MVEEWNERKSNKQGTWDQRHHGAHSCHCWNSSFDSRKLRALSPGLEKMTQSAGRRTDPRSVCWAFVCPQTMSASPGSWLHRTLLPLQVRHSHMTGLAGKI